MAMCMGPEAITIDRTRTAAPRAVRADRTACLVIGLLAGASAHAVGPADSTALRGLRVAAFVDVYFAYDFGHSRDDERPRFLYQYDRHSEVDLNLGLLQVAYDRPRTRAALGVMAGTYAQANLIAEPDLLRHVFEARVGMALDRRRTLWLDAGIMPSHIGLESAIGIDNWTLTRSIAAENSPYYMSGAKLTWTAHPKWEVAAVYLNGWQRIRRVQNDTPCLGTQLVWRPKDGLTLNWSTFAGSDVPDSLGLYRAFSNLFGTWTRGGWGVQAGLDVGVQEARGTGPLETWWTPLLIVRRQLGERVRLVARAEHYADPDQVILSTGTVHGFTTMGYSLGCDVRVVDEVWARSEVRTFHGVDAIYDSIHGPVQDNTSITVSVAARF